MKITDHEVFKDNPSQAGLRRSKALKFSWRQVDPTKVTPMANMDTGETVFVSSLGNVKVILADNTEFVKVFGAGCTNLLKLSSAGVAILAYVLSVLKRDSDGLSIDVGLAKEWCGWNSRTQVYSGICNLLEHEFLYRKVGTGGEYYINVNYFFNGKRTNLEYASNLKSRLVSEAKKGRIDLKSGHLDTVENEEVE